MSLRTRSNLAASEAKRALAGSNSAGEAINSNSTNVPRPSIASSETSTVRPSQATNALRRDLRTSATGRNPRASNKSPHAAVASAFAQRQLDLPPGLRRGVDLRAFVGDETAAALLPQPQRLVGGGEISRRMGEVKVPLLPRLGDLRPQAPPGPPGSPPGRPTGNFCSTSYCTGCMRMKSTQKGPAW